MVSLSPSIQALVQDKIRAGGRSGDAELEGLTLFGTIGAPFHLRADGSIWINEWEHDSADPNAYLWREASAQEAAGALKVAATRVPQLLSLVPQQGSAPTCAKCHGSGNLTLGEQTIKGVWCDRCCGLGFVGAA